LVENDKIQLKIVECREEKNIARREEGGRQSAFSGDRLGYRRLGWRLGWRLGYRRLGYRIGSGTTARLLTKRIWWRR